MRRSWQPARCSTVIGAAHRRRGQPCQDASLAMALSDPQGEPLQLMAVADGHGNRRHWLSQVGSALACQQAERVVREALASTPLNDQASWQLLLQEHLPAALVQGWLQATAADWAARPEGLQQTYTPLPYGCTLGLVLMAPRWWAHTGLGDWDLVGVGGGVGGGVVEGGGSADGSGSATAQLLSDEQDLVGGSEATASLCLAEAAALFPARTGLYPLASSDPPLRLVLSTDGVRKSCASDDDFLRLCSQLGNLTDAAALHAGLEQITQQGSGDDVSVALSGWGDVQAWPAIASDTPQADPQNPATDRLHANQRFGLRIQPPWLLPGLLGAALLTGAGWWWQQRPSPLAREIARLCAEPWGIQATLNQRRAQFQQLAGPGGAVLTERLRRDATHDPLGALIATSRSRQQPDQACPALQRELAEQWRRTADTAVPAGRMTPGPSRRPAPLALPSSPP